MSADNAAGIFKRRYRIEHLCERCYGTSEVYYNGRYFCWDCLPVPDDTPRRRTPQQGSRG